MTAQLLNILTALTFVLLLIFGLAFLLRRYAPAMSRSTVQLRVLASLPLGGKERVILIKAGEEFLVLGVSPGRVQTLHRLEKDALLQPGLAADVEPENAAAGFASILQNLYRKD